MKTLMLTTALVTATAFGAAAQTGTETEQEMNGAGGAQGMVPAFLSSDFTGMNLYTLDSESVAEVAQDGMAAEDRDRLRWTSSDAFLADRDNWENVGNIDDIVMTQDGAIRGVLVDVGGFLGFGTHTVMVDIDELYFVSEEQEAEDIDDFFVVVAMSTEQLENLPEWDPEQLSAGFEMRTGTQTDAMEHDEDDTAAAVPSNGADAMEEDTAATAEPANGSEVMGEGFATLDESERTADRLIGADVYDAQGENIGSVDDVVLAEDQRITDIVVDVGGFLGIGAHSVALPIDDAKIAWHDEDGEARVQVSLTADQLEAMPEYEG